MQRMTKKWLVVVGVVVAVAVVGTVLATGVFAQGPTPTPPAPGTGTTKSNTYKGALGEIATLLGMTPDQIQAERVLGKTLADLAREKGVDTQKLVDVLVADQKAVLDNLVTKGRMTQAQADTYLNWYRQLAALQLTEPYGPGLGGFGGFGCGFGRGIGRGGGFGGFGGMMRGFHRYASPQSPTPTPAPSSSTT
jgi:hypothetical protein